MEFDLLFRWFVGLSIDEKVFDASTFSKNRDRLLTHEIAQEFLSSLLGLPEVKGPHERGAFFGRRNAVEGLGVDEELSAEGRLGRAASPGRNGEADFRKTSDRTQRTPRRPTRMRASSARAPGRRAVLPISAMP